MLLGEHAVLQGHAACVGAIQKYIHVALIPRTDRHIHISSVLGEHHTTLGELEPHPDFQFVLEAIRRTPPQRGFDLAITSEMSSVMGLGTSAAVTVAVWSALQVATGKNIADRLQAARECRDIIRCVQGGVGSGADVFASTFGGLLLFRQDAEPRQLTTFPPVTLLYSGMKVPTPQVIAIVNALRGENRLLFSVLDAFSNELAETAFQAAQREDWAEFASCMTRNQSVLAKYGVNTPRLQALIDQLVADSGIRAAKISGSGLGDCVVGLGRAQRQTWDAPALTLELSSRGVEVETLEQACP